MPAISDWRPVDTCSEAESFVKAIASRHASIQCIKYQQKAPHGCKVYYRCRNAVSAGCGFKMYSAHREPTAGHSTAWDGHISPKTDGDTTAGGSDSSDDHKTGGLSNVFDLILTRCNDQDKTDKNNNTNGQKSDSNCDSERDIPMIEVFEVGEHNHEVSSDITTHGVGVAAAGWKLHTQLTLPPSCYMMAKGSGNDDVSDEGSHRSGSAGQKGKRPGSKEPKASSITPPVPNLATLNGHPTTPNTTRKTGLNQSCMQGKDVLEAMVAALPSASATLCPSFDAQRSQIDADLQRMKAEQEQLMLMERQEQAQLQHLQDITAAVQMAAATGNMSQVPTEVLLAIMGAGGMPGAPLLSGMGSDNGFGGLIPPPFALPFLQNNSSVLNVAQSLPGDQPRKKRKHRSPGIKDLNQLPPLKKCRNAEEKENVSTNDAIFDDIVNSVVDTAMNGSAPPQQSDYAGTSQTNPNSAFGIFPDPSQYLLQLAQPTHSAAHNVSPINLHPSPDLPSGAHPHMEAPGQNHSLPGGAATDKAASADSADLLQNQLTLTDCSDCNAYREQLLSLDQQNRYLSTTAATLNLKVKEMEKRVAEMETKAGTHEADSKQLRKICQDLENRQMRVFQQISEYLATGKSADILSNKNFLINLIM